MKKAQKIILGVVGGVIVLVGLAIWARIFVEQFREARENGLIQTRREKNTELFESIGDILDKRDLIVVDEPKAYRTVTSPLTIRGQARGTWFFEASFPVVLTDWDGRIIAQGIAQAQDEWMTEDFVPFEVTLEFTNPAFPNTPSDHFSRRGALILQKDNPSGLPEHDDALEIPIQF